MKRGRHRTHAKRRVREFAGKLPVEVARIDDGVVRAGSLVENHSKVRPVQAMDGRGERDGGTRGMRVVIGRVSAGEMSIESDRGSSR